MALEQARKLIARVEPVTARMQVFAQLLRTSRRCDGEVDPELYKEGFALVAEIRDEESGQGKQNGRVPRGGTFRRDMLERALISELAIDDFERALKYVRDMPDGQVRISGLMAIVDCLPSTFLILRSAQPAAIIRRNFGRLVLDATLRNDKRQTGETDIGWFRTVIIRTRRMPQSVEPAVAADVLERDFWTTLSTHQAVFSGQVSVFRERPIQVPVPFVLGKFAVGGRGPFVKFLKTEFLQYSLGTVIPGQAACMHRLQAYFDKTACQKETVPRGRVAAPPIGVAHKKSQFRCLGSTVYSIEPTYTHQQVIDQNHEYLSGLQLLQPPHPANPCTCVVQ